jgi:hypothetical protein
MTFTSNDRFSESARFEVAGLRLAWENKPRFTPKLG